MRPSQEGLHRGATPPGAGQMREALQHLAPPPSRRSATTSEEFYLSSLAPLLTTIVDMDVVVRGLSFPGPQAAVQDLQQYAEPSARR